jgi:outer membrane lipoprotein SlyB
LRRDTAKEIEMTAFTDRSPNLLMWIASIAVILFSVAGIAAIMGWIPTSMGRSADNAELVPSARVATNTASDTAPETPATAEPRVVPVPAADNPPERATCAACGVIESTRVVTTKGEGSGIGAAGGAVVGGLLGNQIGAGRGNTVATAIGAVGGAVAGNEVEKRVKSKKYYAVTVRFDDGSRRVINETNPPAWRTGDNVKVVRGAIEANR